MNVGYGGGRSKRGLTLMDRTAGRAAGGFPLEGGPTLHLDPPTPEWASGPCSPPRHPCNSSSECSFLGVLGPSPARPSPGGPPASPSSSPSPSQPPGSPHLPQDITYRTLEQRIPASPHIQDTRLSPPAPT